MRQLFELAFTTSAIDQAILLIIEIKHLSRLTITKYTRNLLWLSTTIIGVYSMYSVTFYYVPSYNYSSLESALYNSLHRLGWSLFTGWMVLACVTSDDGALRSFLASRALVPLSRLTYCAYLTNGFIELYLAASIRTPKFMSVTNLVITKTLINDQNVKLISLFHRSSAKRSLTCV